MKYRIKSDEFQFVLYEENSTRNAEADDPMDNLKGHRAVGHYATLEGLLEGVRGNLLRSKAKKSRDLEDFLKIVVSSQQEIRAEIKKIAFLASKAKPRPGGVVSQTIVHEDPS
jgi:hypothetical protein